MKRVRVRLTAAPQFRCETDEAMRNKCREIYLEIENFISFLAKMSGFEDDKNSVKLIFEISVDEKGNVNFGYITSTDVNIIKSYLMNLRNFHFICEEYSENKFKKKVLLFERRLTYGLNTNNLDWACNDGDIPVINEDVEYDSCEPYRIPFCEDICVNKDSLPSTYWNTLIYTMPRLLDKIAITMEVSKIDYAACRLKKWIKPMTFSAKMLGKSVCSDILRGKNIYCVKTYLNTSLVNEDKLKKVKEYICSVVLSDLDLSKFADVSDVTQEGNKRLCNNFYEFSDMLCKMYTEEELTTVLMMPYTFNDAFRNIKTEVIKEFKIPTVDSKEVHIQSIYEDKTNQIELGRLNKDYLLTIDPVLLTQHVFVTGTTGSGKSTYINQLLKSIPKTTKCLIIDPVKDEYGYFWNELVRNGFRNPARIIRAEMNDEGVIEKFNLFVVPKGIQLNIHIALLDKVFCSIISSKDEVVYSYVQGMIFYTYKEHIREQLKKYSNWDFDSRNGKIQFQSIWEKMLLKRDYYYELVTEKNYKVPTLMDFQAYGMKWLNSICEQDTKGAKSVLDFFQRWFSRLREAYPCFYKMFSLSKPQEYYNYINDIDKKDILVFMNALRDVAEKKAIFMYFVGILDEYRRGIGIDSQELKHLTILEEAHTIATATPKTDAEIKTNQMISDMLAEIRAYGEGIIVAEQSPQKLIMDVITNTSIKIIKRIGNGIDVDYIQSAIGLNNGEAKALNFLNRSEAVAYVSGLSCPVLLNNEYKK